MSVPDFKNLTAEQQRIFEEIWKYCTYFQAAPPVDDDVLAKAARQIGSLMTQFQP